MAFNILKALVFVGGLSKSIMILVDEINSNVTRNYVIEEYCKKFFGTEKGIY